MLNVLIENYIHEAPLFGWWVSGREMGLWIRINVGEGCNENRRRESFVLLIWMIRLLTGWVYKHFVDIDLYLEANRITRDSSVWVFISVVLTRMFSYHQQ